MYNYSVHLQCTSTVYIYSVHLQCTFTVYIYSVQLQCTSTVYNYSVHLQCTYTVYIYSVHQLIKVFSSPYFYKFSQQEIDRCKYEMNIYFILTGCHQTSLKLSFLFRNNNFSIFAGQQV